MDILEPEVEHQRFATVLFQDTEPFDVTEREVDRMFTISVRWCFVAVSG